MTQGERSERDRDLQQVAHDLAEIAATLPDGWYVAVNGHGQLQMLPPSRKALDQLREQQLRELGDVKPPT